MDVRAIIRSLHATTGALKKTVAKLEAEARKRAKADLETLAAQAKEEVTTNLLRLLSKLNG